MSVNVFSGGKNKTVSKSDLVNHIYGESKKSRKSKKSKINKSKVAHPKTGAGILSMYPPRKFVKLNYEALETLSSETVLSTPGTVLSVYGVETIFNLCGLYQPRYSGSTGLRPQGFDQMSSVYAKYKVYGVKISLRFYDPNIDGMMCAAQMQCSNEASSIAGQQISTYGMEKWAFQRPISNTGSQQVFYNRYASLRKLDGLSKVQYECNLTYDGTLASNPSSNGPFLRIAVANGTNTTDGFVKCLVKLEFYTQFYDRKILASSF